MLPFFVIASLPEFLNVLYESPSMMDYLYNNQIQRDSKVSDGVIYERRHPGGQADLGFEQLLQETMTKFDSRFSQGVSPYWTFQITLARKNSGSKWHNYANSLPAGIQTIRWRKPIKWATSLTQITWSDVRTTKVIVY